MTEQTGPPTDPELAEALGLGEPAELPPNVPPGILGERGLDLRKVDGEGSHGLNAGLIQEWTWETTVLVTLLVYFLFFPAAYVILWRSRKVSRNQKLFVTAAMTAGLAYVAYRLLAG